MFPQVYWTMIHASPSAHLRVPHGSLSGSGFGRNFVATCFVPVCPPVSSALWPASQSASCTALLVLRSIDEVPRLP
jgi:hypothetical protein